MYNLTEGLLCSIKIVLNYSKFLKTPRKYNFDEFSDYIFTDDTKNITN